MNKAFIIAAGTTLVGSGLAAQTAFTPPSGCEITVSVQQIQCEVMNFWTCEAEPGMLWAGFFDAEGLSVVQGFTDDFGWVDIFFARDGVLEYYDQETNRPTSLKETLANGVYGFSYISRDRDGTELARYQGFDWLTGREVVIDGFTMLEARFGLRATFPDGSDFFLAEGTEFVSEELGLFLSGPVTYDDEPGVIYDSTPIDIILPGEPDFGLSTPLYGCAE